MLWKRTPTGGWQLFDEPDRTVLWPTVGLFPMDVEREIADMLAPRPRLPTPEYSLQLMHHPCDHADYRHGSQFLDAVNRFIASHWDEVRAARSFFVDWDAQGRAIIDLSRAPDSDDEDLDDSDADDEYLPGDLADALLADALLDAQIVIDEISAEAEQILYL